MKALFGTVAAVVMFAVSPALADSLDGHWCSKDGRRLHIQGPAIVTPGGTSMQGDYQRHSFSYIVPANEPGAGSFIYLQQWSEEMMKSFSGADEASARQGEGQVWNRCAPTTS
jgi:hypothetical protein